MIGIIHAWQYDDCAIRALRIREWFRSNYTGVMVNKLNYLRYPALVFSWLLAGSKIGILANLA